MTQAHDARVGHLGLVALRRHEPNLVTSARHVDLARRAGSVPPT